jgi:hypothetical protein
MQVLLGGGGGFVSGGRPEASKRNLNFQGARWHHFKIWEL